MGQRRKFVMSAQQPGAGTSGSAGQRGVVVAQQVQYSGPIPPAAELERYNAVLSGAADRILRMAEVEQQARIEREGHANREVLRLFGRGQLYGVILASGAFILAGYVAHLGQGLGALGVFFSALAALVGCFVYDKRRAKGSGESKS